MRCIQWVSLKLNKFLKEKRNVRILNKIKYKEISVSVDNKQLGKILKFDNLLTALNFEFNKRVSNSCYLVGSKFAEDGNRSGKLLIKESDASIGIPDKQKLICVLGHAMNSSGKGAFV